MKYLYLPAYEYGTDSVPKRRRIKIQTPGNYPEGSIHHSKHGECLVITVRFTNHMKTNHLTIKFRNLYVVVLVAIECVNELI